MAKPSQWKHVPGTFSIELDVLDFGEDCESLGVVEIDTDIPLPAFLMEHVALHEDCELVIEFESSGSHTEASMYGGPDRMGWPAEHEEERTLRQAYITPDGGSTKRFPPQLEQEALFELFRERIDATELDEAEPA